MGKLVIGVSRRTLANHGTLRHAVAMGHRDPHLGLYLEEHLRRLGRPPTGQQAQRRDDWFAGLLTLDS